MGAIPINPENEKTLSVLGEPTRRLVIQAALNAGVSPAEYVNVALAVRALQDLRHIPLSRDDWQSLVSEISQQPASKNFGKDWAKLKKANGS